MASSAQLPVLPSSLENPADPTAVWIYGEVKEIMIVLGIDLSMPDPVYLLKGQIPQCFSHSGFVSTSASGQALDNSE